MTMNVRLSDNKIENITSTAPTTPKVCFITMGCAKNEVDTAHMKERVVSAGFLLEEEAESADVVVVNTCSFIEAATQESLDVIFEVAGLPQYLQGSIKLVVAGCMPARYKDDLSAELNEVSAFVPCSEEDNIALVISKLFADPENPHVAKVSNTNKVANVSDLSNASRSNSNNDSSPNLDKEISASTYTPTAGPYSTYVKISDGCNRYCSFCSIPYIRGRYHSFSYENICSEVYKAKSAGVREIVLIAQDTGRWGNDFDESLTTSWLIDNLASYYPDLYFRIMYLQPEQIDDDLLNVMKSHDNIINYLDIPLQHINARLISDMNRVGSRVEFEHLIEHIKCVIPDITLRTTLIAGFPSETDDDFEELCDFCEQGFFDYVGVFAYSREEGTRAYNLPCQIDEEEKQQRAQRLTDIANTVCATKIKEREGQILPVLIEGVNDEGNRYGRALCQAPEVDGITYIDEGECGSVVHARVVDSLFFDMEAELAER